MSGEELSMDPPEQVRTAYLDRFNEMEAEVVVEVLREAGIFAMTKTPMTESAHDPYIVMQERGVVLVDAAKLEEARSVLRAEMPEHLEKIKGQMDLLEGMDDSPDPEA